MKRRSTLLMSLTFNVLIIAFFVVMYLLIHAQVSAVFSAHDRQLHQEKVDLIARAIRHSVMHGDYVAVRRVFQGSMTDKTLQMIRIAPADGSEGICVGLGENCYGNAQKLKDYVVSKMYFDAQGKDLLGTIYIAYAQLYAVRLTRAISICIGVILISALLFFNLLFGSFLRVLRRQLTWNVDAVSSMARGKPVAVAPNTFVGATEFSSALDELGDVLTEYEKAVQEESERKTFLQVAHQVLHDIRAPLQMLDVGLSDLSGVQEERRPVVRAALDRMRRTVTTLLEQYRIREGARDGVAKQPSEETTVETTVEPIAALVKSITLEKQVQYQTHPEVKLGLKFSDGSSALFARVNADSFQAVISNLIDNSVEAIERAGVVSVSVAELDGEIEICVADNGKGIPADVIPKLFRRGVTFGKTTGSGIGLYHAKTTIESFSGRVRIDSMESKGTTLFLTIPKAAAPPWSVSAIDLSDVRHCVIVDDDELIHEMWNKRVREIDNGAIKMTHFRSVQKFVEWGESGDLQVRNGSLYMVDLEFVGENLNGIDAIRRLDLADKAILVTRSYNEVFVTSACDTLKLRLLPKMLAEEVGIRN